MRGRLSRPPAEVPANRDLGALAPAFRDSLGRVLERLARQGYPARVAETARDDERQLYLYGFGRQYDDGRGVVTAAREARTSWHGYGLAADVIHATLAWDAPAAFWAALARAARAEGLATGADWSTPDRPHVQWAANGTPASPDAQAWSLYDAGGVASVWRAYGADGGGGGFFDSFTLPDLPDVPLTPDGAPDINTSDVALPPNVDAPTMSATPTTPAGYLAVGVLLLVCGLYLW